MKIIENLLLKTCGYAVIILTSFYLFATLSEYADAYIGFPTFLVILAFGLLISAAGMIFKIEKIHMALRVLIHYASLLAAFCVIFISLGNLSAGSAGAVFSAVIIFTLFYGAIFAVVYFLRLLIKKSDSSLNQKISKKSTEPSAKKEYKPLYKSED